MFFLCILYAYYLRLFDLHMIHFLKIIWIIRELVFLDTGYPNIFSFFQHIPSFYIVINVCIYLPKSKSDFPCVFVNFSLIVNIYTATTLGTPKCAALIVKVLLELRRICRTYLLILLHFDYFLPSLNNLII